MDTRFLLSYVTVVECGSLAEAARRLDITPAALAARIRTLEEDLGAVLLRRSGRAVKPTEAGLQILDQSRNVLSQVSDLRAAATNRQGIGQLRVGSFFSASTALLPPLLDSLYRELPDLSVFVDVGYSPELSRKVIAGELDAAIVVEHQFIIPKSCEWHPLTEDPLVVVAPRNLAGEKDAHALLAREPFIQYDRRIWGGRLADRYLRERGIQPRVRLEIDGLMTIAALVSRGIGISLLPDWAPMWIPTLPLVRIPLPGPAPTRRIGVLRQVRGPRDHFVNALLRHATEVCSAGVGEP
ncbi:LysR family transcriptional regulator [Cupriavidus pauculus]|uniref:LysR family transcriptional regulator n=1 Tax=Cupriavidus pauculus TaxID=82633 RepID=A0A2N5C3M4_9BURK|nr:LysR family transcriptional regulator [Cupriavidus pauculus]PLP96807.1 LysR family transcriptional regulator [Cupriavidus pauculus]